MGPATTAPGARRALALMREAGWTVRDRRLVNAQGQPFEFEILLQGPTFERVALPYVQWLERIGVTARVRTVDPAQYQVRIDAFDYDMTIDGRAQGFSPGNEQRDYWSSAKASEQGSQNVAGIADPVIDEMVELVIAAPGLRRAGGAHAGAGPRAAAPQLRHPALAQPDLPHRLLGQVRPAGAQSDATGSASRRLVGGPGEGRAGAGAGKPTARRG